MTSLSNENLYVPVTYEFHIILKINLRFDVTDFFYENLHFHIYYKIDYHLYFCHHDYHIQLPSDGRQPSHICCIFRRK